MAKNSYSADKGVFPWWEDGWLNNLKGEKASITVTSPLGYRDHPTGGVRKFHSGVDISTNGQHWTVNAPSRCKITKINRLNNNTAGKYIWFVIPVNVMQASYNSSMSSYMTGKQKMNAQERLIRNGQCVYVGFFHLNEINEKLKVGEWVDAGKYFGKTGMTGVYANGKPVSTGIHLHITVRIGAPDSTVYADATRFMNITVKGKTKEIQALVGKSWIPPRKLPLIYFEAIAGKVADIPNYTYQEQETEKLDLATLTEDPSATVNTQLANGIWQIIKLGMDSDVAQRQIVDPSIAVETGSLLNWFRKVCQEPFVEFMGDTYGDQYYFIARKPPFDRESVRGASVITVKADNVIQSSLAFSRQAYSWFAIQPATAFDDNTREMFFPAVFFPEFAAIYGSNPLIIRDNYWNDWRTGKDDKEGDKKALVNVTTGLKNSLRDFIYMIESHVYLPFTREGTITIQGDRRIKRGGWILLQDSDEMFYVEAVTNEFTSFGNGVSRTTTLQVSHGMKTRYIEEDITSVDNLPYMKHPVSYFNLIDFALDDAAWNDENFEPSKVINNFRVNTDVLTFFLSKLQMLN